MSVKQLKESINESVVGKRFQEFINHPKSNFLLIGMGYLLLLAVPFLTGSFFTRVVAEALILGILAVAVNIALGYVGLLTLAPAAFFGIGAYSVAKIVTEYEGTYPLGVVIGVLLAAVTGFIIGYAPIKKRMEPVYFAVFTLAFGVIAYDFTYSATELTGGANGLGFVSYPEFLGIDLGSGNPQYYFIHLMTTVVLAGIYLLLRSDYRLILHGIRQNDRRMQYLGYNTGREQMIAWVLSCSLSAFAGALYVGVIGLAAPSMVSFDLTGEVIIWIIVGGIGTIAGPFIAAVLLNFLEAILGGVWAEGYLIILGILFISFVFLLPDGIIGRLDKLRER
ncbi:branched-chain amino acid ABC transporter permease [Saliphagus sp. GCM10025334]